MKFKAISIILTMLLLSMSFYGCTNNDNNNKATNDLKNEVKLKDQKISDLETKLKTNMDMTNTLTTGNSELQKKLIDVQKQAKSQQSTSILNEALTVINLLKIKDMNGLASHIHPNKGLRFTPYSYIRLQSDLVFTSSQIVSLLQSSQSYNWGVYDGSGNPIQDTFNNYYNKFVYDVDFANPHLIGNNVVVGKGNMTNNIVQAYPNLTFVEFHFTGFNSQYAGHDWKSLRLVFENVSGIWYLVGIVHDQWTI